MIGRIVITLMLLAGSAWAQNPHWYSAYVDSAAVIYAFTNISGSTLSDSSVNANHAMLYGGYTWSSMGTLGAVLFDGTNGYAEAVDTPSLSCTTQMTVVIRLQDYRAGNAGFVQKGMLNATNREWYLGGFDTNVFNFIASKDGQWSAANGFYKYVTPPRGTNLQLNVYVAVYSNNAVSLYTHLGAELVGSQWTTEVPRIHNGSASLRLASLATNIYQRVKLSAVMIVPRAFSSNEVATLVYNLTTNYVPVASSVRDRNYMGAILLKRARGIP